MSLIKPTIVVPDSSHWACWIDEALNSTSGNGAGNSLHNRLIDAGRIPLLSWHHLEELLSIGDHDWARRRIDFVHALPLIAFVRFPNDTHNTGSIIDILCAEVTAVLNGAKNLREVRDSARELMMRTGAGAEIIGSEPWMWDVLREEFLRRHEQAKTIASVRRMAVFDDQRTIGEISRGRIRSDQELKTRISAMRQEVRDHVRTRGDPKLSDPDAVASNFMDMVEGRRLPDGIDVRTLLEMGLLQQGVEPDEIHDDCLLADLNALALFRARLKVVAESLDRPFEDLKMVDMRQLPSWQVENALRQFGQDRPRRFGSDVTDESLTALAPYVDELFVDKRTMEDFRRALPKAGPVAELLGKVRKASNFRHLAEAA